MQEYFMLFNIYLNLLFSKPFLPFNERHEIDCRRDPTEASIGCFLTGDVRANEQVRDYGDE